MPKRAMKRSVRKRGVRILYRVRVRYTETVCWEIVLEAEGDEHARDIVDAGGVDARAHRFPRWSMAIIKSRASS
jgi:glycine/D-amino acid oxidase-like deaminating enzyme